MRNWETGQGVVNTVNQALTVHATSGCLVWPKDLTNPDLSDHFVGIERFLSASFIEHVRDTLGLTLTTPAGGHNPPTWRYDVDRQELSVMKSAIHLALMQRNKPADIAPLSHALPWLGLNSSPHRLCSRHVDRF